MQDVLTEVRFEQKRRKADTKSNHKKKEAKLSGLVNTYYKSSPFNLSFQFQLHF